MKEGRPLPQDAAAMIPDGFEDVHWKPQSRPRSRGGNTYVDRFRQIKRSHFRQLNRFLVYYRRYPYIYRLFFLSTTKSQVPTTTKQMSTNIVLLN